MFFQGTRINVASKVVDACDICCVGNSNNREVAVDGGGYSHKNSFLLEFEAGTFLILQAAAGQG